MTGESSPQESNSTSLLKQGINYILQGEGAVMNKRVAILTGGGDVPGA